MFAVNRDIGEFEIRVKALKRVFCEKDVYTGFAVCSIRMTVAVSIAGYSRRWHRFATIHDLLGWTEIPCIICKAGDIIAEMISRGLQHRLPSKALAACGECFGCKVRLYAFPPSRHSGNGWRRYQPLSGACAWNLKLTWNSPGNASLQWHG